jgi:hypothetical protein
MGFFRQYIAPLIAVLGFLIALFFVSIRIFLPGDMAAPAPIDLPTQSTSPTVPPSEQAAIDLLDTPASLSMLTKGVPIDQPY